MKNITPLHNCCFFSLIISILLLLPCHITSSSSSSLIPFSTHNTPSCRRDQSLSLLQFKAHLNSQFRYLPKYASWKVNTDCCTSWDGVTCDDFGFVIGLDVSGSFYNAFINSNSSLFNLHRLKALNLAGNTFLGFPFPTLVAKLRSLTYFNFSYSSYPDNVPSQISQLTNLTSLDLSHASFANKVVPLKFSKLTNMISLRISGLTLESPVALRTLISNFSSLEELYLDEATPMYYKNQGIARDWFKAVASIGTTLRILQMSNMGLSGPMGSSLLNFSSLSQLYLSFNNITHFPQEMFNLPNLRILDLSGNKNLTLSVLEFPPKDYALRQLIVGGINFFGSLPHSIGKLNLLTKFDASNCNLLGTIPSSILSKLSKLEELDMSGNAFVDTLSSIAWSNLSSLRTLDLSYNLLTGKVPHSLFSMPSLEKMHLASNQLSGELDDEFFHGPSSSPLREINLCNNKLEGRIPFSFSKISKLEIIMLCSNNFRGMVDPRIFKNLKQLAIVDLSDNNFLSIDTNEFVLSLPHLHEFIFSSCNLSEFPRFLKHQENPYELDLSNNNIQGKVPGWIWNKVTRLRLANNSMVGFEDPSSNHSLSKLLSLDLSDNSFEGSIPSFFGTSLSGISLSNNKFTGEIPSYLCNPRLSVIDFSKNQIGGRIPSCLTKLQYVYLHQNKLQGSIPDNFDDLCSLTVLALHGNQLQGKLPRSLANCSGLQQLDVGENQINDAFPFWLESLPYLELLILRSNRFHGTIEQHRYGQLSKNSFLGLHIIDLSSNNFKGHLPFEYFRSSKPMTAEVSTNNQLVLAGIDSISLMVPVMIQNKGQVLGYVPTQISLINAIDLSSNQFSGEIPEIIGDFRSLNVLNLSHNSIAGKIPSSIKNLSDLQSLDLSNNDLSGEIPSELTSLTFLSALNLSWNRLVGRIPSGNQLDTFASSSFEGNLGLCGSQLQIECDRKKNDNVEASKAFQENSSGTNFNWMFVVAGYGSGLVVGFVIEHFIFSRNMYYLGKLLNISRFFQGNRSLGTQRGRRRN